METLENTELSLEKQLHELLQKLVAKEVDKRLKNLFQLYLLPEEPVKIGGEAHSEAKEIVRGDTNDGGKGVVREIVCGDTNDGREVKEAPKKPCEHKIKRMLREMTPDLTRRELPLLIQVRMLMKLYEQREEGIAAKELFSYAGTGKIAGYRYVSFFKEQGLMTFIGARKEGKYILTLKGTGLLEMQ
jgi:hypothetical protein